MLYLLLFSENTFFTLGDKLKKKKPKNLYLYKYNNNNIRIERKDCKHVSS